MLLRSLHVGAPTFQDHGIEIVWLRPSELQARSGHQISRNLTGQNLADLLGLSLEELLQLFFQTIELALLLLPALDNIRGRQRILAQFGAGEDALKSVEVVSGDGVVLVVVTLGAGHGERHESASGHVDAVILELRTQAVESKPGKI